MSEPKRLVEDGATDFERLLLRSAMADGPSPAARQIAAGAVLAGASLAATAAKGAALKWVLLATLGVGVTVAGIQLANRAPEPAPRVTPLPTHRHAAASPVPAPVYVPDEAPTPAPEPTLKHVKVKPVPVKDVAPDLSLRLEVELLDGARAAMAGKDLAQASHVLDRYDREFAFPKGVLRPEAGALRIEVLLAQGDRGQAWKLAQRFLDRHPHSPVASRIRSLFPEEVKP